MVAKVLLFLSIVYTGILTWFSLTQLSLDFRFNLGEFDLTDKALHAGAYLGLVMIWKLFFLFKNSNFQKYRSNLWLVALGSFLFGTLIEVLQGTLTSYREPDWYDMLANGTGVLLAVMLFIMLAPSVKSIKQKIAF